MDIRLSRRTPFSWLVNLSHHVSYRRHNRPKKHPVEDEPRHACGVNLLSPHRAVFQVGLDAAGEFRHNRRWSPTHGWTWLWCLEPQRHRVQPLVKIFSRHWIDRV